MNIDFNDNLDKDFVKYLDELKDEYGNELSKLNGLDNSNLNFTDFIDNFIKSKTVAETTIDANSSSTFEFKMWLDYNSDNEAMDKAFVGKIEIEEIGQHE